MNGQTVSRLWGSDKAAHQHRGENGGTSGPGSKNRKGKRKPHSMLQETTQRPPTRINFIQVLLSPNSFTLITFKNVSFGGQISKGIAVSKRKKG